MVEKGHQLPHALQQILNNSEALLSRGSFWQLCAKHTANGVAAAACNRAVAEAESPPANTRFETGGGSIPSPVKHRRRVSIRALKVFLTGAA
jgi:hypothetical protein